MNSSDGTCGVCVNTASGKLGKKAVCDLWNTRPIEDALRAEVDASRELLSRRVEIVESQEIISLRGELGYARAENERLTAGLAAAKGVGNALHDAIVHTMVNLDNPSFEDVDSLNVALKAWRNSQATPPEEGGER